jgi:hypothetical protein
MMIQDLMNHLNLDQMSNDVDHLLMMMINLHKNINDLELKLMMMGDVQMNQQEYILYHLNINLTIHVDHEWNTMDKES